MNFPQLPSFYSDPYFLRNQDALQNIGTDFMAGNVPEYYRSIGQAGSPEFEDMLRLGTEDITRAGYESAARMGTRGGATQSNILKNVRSMTAPMRWADFTRSLEGRQGFLKTGVEAITGVRNAGLQFGGQKNSFNLGIAGIESNRAIADANAAAQEKAAKNQMWSDIISGALGAGGAMYGAKAGADMFKSLANPGSAASKSILGGGDVGGYDNLGGLDDLDFFSGRLGSGYGL